MNGYVNAKGTMINVLFSLGFGSFRLGLHKKIELKAYLQ